VEWRWFCLYLAERKSGARDRAEWDQRGGHGRGGFHNVIGGTSCGSFMKNKRRRRARMAKRFVLTTMRELVLEMEIRGASGEFSEGGRLDKRMAARRL